MPKIESGSFPVNPPSKTCLNCTSSIFSLKLDIINESYKQVTVGDCNIPRPGGILVKGQMKWEAWDSVRGKGGSEMQLTW